MSAAEATRHRQQSEQQVIIHDLDEKASSRLKKLRLTTKIPQSLPNNIVLFLANIDMSNFYGKVIMLQKPKNGVLSPYDWIEPRLESTDWEFVGNIIISYSDCLRLYESECIRSLLEKHFKQWGLENYGWEEQKDDQENITALIIRDFSKN